MSPHDYLAPVSKPWRLFIGWILGLCGLLCLLVAAGMSLLILRGGEQLSAGIVLVLFLLLGVPCCVYSFRLLTGRGRPDGGLVSPLVLRAVGAALLVHPLASLLFLDWKGLLLSAMLAGASGACFALAAYRKRRSPRPAEISSFEPR